MLEARCAKMEQEIEMNEDFNREFTPRKPRKLRKTRWDFDALNKENDRINMFARRAFDPSNRFIAVSNFTFDEDIEIQIVPAITEPHRITGCTKKTQPAIQRFIDKYDDSAYVPKSVPHNLSVVSARSSSRRSSHTGSVSMRGSFAVDLDDTVDKFVDDIERLRD